MLANLPYKAWLDGLAEERLENKKRIYRYNNIPPENEKIWSLSRLFTAIMAATSRWERIFLPTIISPFWMWER